MKDIMSAGDKKGDAPLHCAARVGKKTQMISCFIN
jgi:hypothetical protein